MRKTGNHIFYNQPRPELGDFIIHSDPSESSTTQFGAMAHDLDDSHELVNTTPTLISNSRQAESAYIYDIVSGF
jgi:hypothetical protein